MHDTARYTGMAFFNCYGKPNARVLDVGSYDVNGTLRDYVPSGYSYTGIDISAGPGVDIFLPDPYSWKMFEDASFDLVVSTSCMEHDDMFWLSFLEMTRVVRPDGFIYLSVPSNGPYHGYPGDSWRLYPDAGLSLEKWAKHNGREIELIESFILPPRADVWYDFVAVFGKSESAPQRIVSRFPEAQFVRQKEMLTSLSPID